MKLQKFFSPFSWTEFDTLLHTLTNDHNFDVDTVSFGGQFCFQTFLSQTIKSLSLAHSEFFCKKPFFNVMMCYFLGGITHNFSLDFVKYKESPQIEILNQIFFGLLRFSYGTFSFGMCTLVCMVYTPGCKSQYYHLFGLGFGII